LGGEGDFGIKSEGIEVSRRSETRSGAVMRTRIARGGSGETARESKDLGTFAAGGSPLPACRATATQAPLCMGRTRVTRKGIMRSKKRTNQRKGARGSAKKNSSGVKNGGDRSLALKKWGTRKSPGKTQQRGKEGDFEGRAF